MTDISESVAQEIANAVADRRTNGIALSDEAQEKVAKIRAHSEASARDIARLEEEIRLLDRVRYRVCRARFPFRALDGFVWPFQEYYEYRVPVYSLFGLFIYSIFGQQYKMVQVKQRPNPETHMPESELYGLVTHLAARRAVNS